MDQPLTRFVGVACSVGLPGLTVPPICVVLQHVKHRFPGVVICYHVCTPATRPPPRQRGAGHG